jgi:hypothetical protein
LTHLGQSVWECLVKSLAEAWSDEDRRRIGNGEGKSMTAGKARGAVAVAALLFIGCGGEVDPAPFSTIERELVG